MPALRYDPGAVAPTAFHAKIARGPSDPQERPMSALDRVHDRPGRALALARVDRRAFLAVVAGGLVAPMAAAGQDRAKARRIGVLGPRTRADSSGFIDAFMQGLRDLG
jgi:hypothetical protein